MSRSDDERRTADPAASARYDGVDEPDAESGSGLPAEESPQPRTLLITGPGGAGCTTVAAASALASAREGRRTLLLSGAPAAVLKAVLGTPVPGGAAGPGTHGTEVPYTDGLLWASRIDSGEHFRGSVAALLERSGTVLDFLGAQPLDEDELTELPGADEFALLSTLYAAHTAGEWDALVVDLPHATDALHLLALPAQLRRYLGRLLPPERQASRALRPALAQLAGVPMPTAALYESAARWEGELVAVQGVLESPGTSVRLVAEPGALAAEALRQARAGLGLYGLALSAVVANRVLPTGSSDPWLSSAAGRQQEVLGAMRSTCRAQELTLRELPHLGREPRGVKDLEALAAAVGAQEPEATVRGAVPVRSPGSVEDRLAQDGLLVWRMPLPSVRKAELELVRRGDELIIGVGPYRRVIPLPSALRRCRVVGAALERGVLRVRCAPDPDLWPQGAQS